MEEEWYGLSNIKEINNNNFKKKTKTPNWSPLDWLWLEDVFSLATEFFECFELLDKS